MKLPNVLTVGRFFFTVGFIYFIKREGDFYYSLALALFALAAISDYWDGYLARKYNICTDFGKIMDPIADKFLILSAFFIFMQWQFIASWMFYAIAFREISVTVSRLSLMRKGKILAAEQEGKVKTVLQMVAIILILIQPLLARAPSFIFGFPVMIWPSLIKFSTVLIPMVIAAAVLLTVYSGIKYFWKNRTELF